MNPVTIPQRNKRAAVDARPAARSACIFCNGELKEPDRTRTILAGAELIIAADGGAKHLAALGVNPDVIIGDMDSLDADTGWNGEGAVRIPHSPAKDRSDAELAVDYAFDHGCDQVTLMAAVGKRLDHTLGNVALVATYPGRVAILDGDSTLVAVDGTKKCMLHGSPGTAVSIISYSPAQVRVRTRGLKYPLSNEPLAFPTRGLSNELSETEACLCVSGGILLVCIQNGRPPSGDNPRTRPSSLGAVGDGEKTHGEPKSDRQDSGQDRERP